METQNARPNGQRVVQYISHTVGDIKEQLQLRPAGIPSITLNRITGLRSINDGGQVKWIPQDHRITYSFPGKTKEEAWRFACVLRILSEIYSAIGDQTVVTKRDIFYRDPALFLKQQVVDQYIDDIAHTCRVPRSDLNVVASPKGLVIGHKKSNDRQEPEMVPASTVLPAVGHVNWVLVVEKEATFNTLVEQEFHLNETVGWGVVVTAKGYPDLATRSFVRAIVDSVEFSGLVFGLFDYDAYGIDILKCYRVGSKASAGEAKLALPEMRWMGVKCEDIVDISGTMPLTRDDRTKAWNLLQGLRLQGTVPGLTDCAQELQRMLMLGKKAEIQSVDSGGRQLSRYLEDKMRLV